MKNTNSLTATARAHTNIAVVKYWGKANEKLILPQSSSLSLTLDRFYTDTQVRFSPQLDRDRIQINQKPVTEDVKIRSVMEMIRKLTGRSIYAQIKSINHVPTAAGLASSASGLAALALAASRAAGLQLSRRDLSRLARHGSGSASRSIYGGWVEWQKGHDDQSSFAFPIQRPELNDVKMIAVVVKKAPKKISSREGMRRSVRTSPYYAAWKRTTAKDLVLAKRAIHQGNFPVLGRVAETNAMRMHALTLSADPPFTYFDGRTLRVIHLVQQLQNRGIACYYTMDAGPNVKIICQNEDCSRIRKSLTRFFTSNQIVVAGPGVGARILLRN